MKWIFVITGLLIHTFLWSQNQLAMFKPSLKDLKIEAPTTTAAYKIIPFQIVNRMIYVEAEVEREPGVFIIDTGCPGVVVNRDMSEKAKSIQAETLSSGLEMHATNIEQLCLGEMELENTTGLAVPFGSFASGHQEKVLGLAGYQPFKDFEILFDYNNQLLHLFPSKDAALHRSTKPVRQIFLSMEGHLPVITLQVGEQRLRFGLDTGAATNIIDAALINELPEEIVKYLPMEQMRCLNGQYQDVEAVNIGKLSIDDYPLQPMKFLFVDLSKVNENTEEQLDGLLGYSFFSQLLCSINYYEKRLNIWERNNVKSVF